MKRYIILSYGMTFRQAFQAAAIRNWIGSYVGPGRLLPKDPFGPSVAPGRSWVCVCGAAGCLGECGAAATSDEEE